MDGWRVGLLIAAGAFFVFLLSKLRPRFGQRPPKLARRGRHLKAEQRLWRRLRRLPRSTQRRIHARLGSVLAKSSSSDDGDGDGDDELDDE